MEFVTNCESETLQVAYDFASKIDENVVVCLNGEMGAGKTVFVKGFCKYFGVNEISSPTFTIVNEYDGTRKIFHFDVYRLSDVDEFYEIGGEEYFERGICIVEWSEIIREALPKKVIDVRIEKTGENTRKITIV